MLLSVSSALLKKPGQTDRRSSSRPCLTTCHKRHCETAVTLAGNVISSTWLTNMDVDAGAAEAPRTSRHRSPSAVQAGDSPRRPAESHRVRGLGPRPGEPPSQPSRAARLTRCLSAPDCVSRSRIGGPSPLRARASVLPTNPRPAPCDQDGRSRPRRCRRASRNRRAGRKPSRVSDRLDDQ